MSSVLYFLVKASRMGKGSLYEISRGSRYTSLQNAAHFAQFPSTEASLLVERPLEISSPTLRKLLRKRVCLEGSTFAMIASVGKWCPCGQEVRIWWYLVIRRGGLECCCLPCSQSCRRVCIGGNDGS